MDYPFLSLDGSGYITEPSLKADAIMASYSATQYSQTILYRDSISSLSKDIQVCSQQWDLLAPAVEKSLNRLFNAYFSQATISVTLDEASYNAPSASFLLLITGTVVQAGQSYDLSKMLQISNGKYSSVTDFGAANAKYA